MRLSRLAGSVSAAVLALLLGAAPALAQTAAETREPAHPAPAASSAQPLDGPSLGTPSLDIPPPPEMVLDLSPAAPHADIATGSVTQRPEAAPEAETALELPLPEMPAADPALAAPQPDAATRQADAPAEIKLDIPPPPVLALDMPAGLELSGAIAEHAEQALALPRLAARERADIRAAYAAHEDRPFWIKGKGWSPAAKQLVAQLGHASEDGLRTADYELPAFEASDRQSLAEADLRLSALAVLYARDARGGRLDPRRLSKMLTPDLALPSATEVLSELAGAEDPGALLAAYNPPHAGYRNLKAKLAVLRAEREESVPSAHIPAGPALRVGMRDDRVPLIRARLGLGSTEDPVFDRSTANALARFQKQAGLRADGVLSDETRSVLSVPPPSRLESDIIAQMERWRWLPADLGATHIKVNIPEFQMRMMRDGKLVHQSRVIVGKPTSATPIFSHAMEYVVVNPSWFVPPSILKKEFLPGLAADPNYAAKRGYVVTKRGNSISVRQPPGERNALGNIKFMFPNDHAVYLHDTPNRRLFANAQRALSHGCVRVQDPMALAGLVLGNGWTAEKTRSLIGRGERTIRLEQPIQIHLAYETLVVDEAGKITSFDDLYGFHRLVRTALERL